MHTAGIDIGSITAKAVIMAEGRVIGTKIIFTGYNAGNAGRRVYDELLRELGLDASQISCTISTGYGRNSIDFANKAITEIICHGTGAHFINPDVRSIIDVGGQDSKALIVDEKGQVKDFVMNDKCAAGTGRFLEVMARALEVDLYDFGQLSLDSRKPSKISSICTVFAESEVISLISKGEKREDIIAGIHESVAARVSALASRIGVRSPLMMTGGVAKNAGVAAALEKKLGIPVEIFPAAQVAGAIGAAVIARRFGSDR
ncbi:MAG: acyl-CoA dehydratase activase [Syntrophales bacterium]|jgi:predicted CoA-substrate-specific enzyme activase|nr:acyl-CoA dehydratase activase [Syntrophales bacterium]MDY0043235.1 acyl-CoA dehydratase activase [Syntrophales bacterium]